MERCRRIAPVTSLQPPYSAVSPDVEKETLPYCERHGIGVIVYSPMKSGLLTGTMTKERVAAFPSDDFRRNALAFQEPHLSKNLKLADSMKAIGSRHGRSAGEGAIGQAGGWRHRRHGVPPERPRSRGNRGLADELRGPRFLR